MGEEGPPHGRRALGDGAGQAPLVEENARLREEVRRSRAFTLDLQSLTAALAAPLDAVAIADLVVSRVHDAIDSTLSAVYFLDETGTQLHLAASRGMTRERLAEMGT